MVSAQQVAGHRTKTHVNVKSERWRVRVTARATGNGQRPALLWAAAAPGSGRGRTQLQLLQLPKLNAPSKPNRTEHPLPRVSFLNVSKQKVQQTNYNVATQHGIFALNRNKPLTKREQIRNPLFSHRNQRSLQLCTRTAF